MFPTVFFSLYDAQGSQRLACDCTQVREHLKSRVQIRDFPTDSFTISLQEIPFMGLMKGI